MSWIDDLYGPRGKEPGNEIPVWSWRDELQRTWVISRVISKLQALKINSHFDVQWASTAYASGVIFRLDRWSESSPDAPRRISIHPSGTPISAVAIIPPHEEGSPPLIRGYPDRWTVELYGRRRPDSHEGPPIDPIELSVWFTFLFDYLRLDPDLVWAGPRASWELPYSGVKLPESPDPEWVTPWPISEDDPRSILLHFTPRSPDSSVLYASMHRLAASFEPRQQTPSLMAMREHRNGLHIRNTFFSLDLFWTIEPTSKLEERHRDQLVFGVSQRSNLIPTWHLTAIDAIKSSGLLLDEDGVDDWIEKRLISGAVPLIQEEDLESYRLLGTMVPLLLSPIEFLEYLEARGISPPWG